MRRIVRSLSSRIFLAATLLAWLSIAAALLFVNARLARESEAALERRLADTTVLVQQQRQALLDTFQRMALLVADLPKLKAAMATNDAPTVAPVAAQYAADLNADLFVVSNATGDVLGTAGPAASTAASVVWAREEGAPGTWVQPLRHGLLQVVTVPVLLGLDSPERLGTLSVGFLLDDRRAAELEQITGVELAFALAAPGTETHDSLGLTVANPTGTAASASPPRQPVLASTLEAMPEHWPAALATPASGRIDIGGVEFAWRSQPLEAIGVGTPVVIVLEPTAASAATLRAVRFALGGIALVTAALAVVVGYGVARTVTRPLAAMTSTMHDMARTGDLTRRFSVQDRGIWSDDDTRLLATTFNALTESIETFQREARERERLSALGRLSTVIAHEIRNPLMIVRGALRQLTRAAAGSPDVREAVQDIEEEVQRLNRVVDDVLDFARPIQLHLAPTDVNDVAAEAIAAAEAARPDAPILAVLAPDLPLIACDGDRLRAVLVNVLSNAQHAVAATTGARHRIELETMPSDAGHGVRIVVRDTGQGVGADELAHVFDPYFTTRRTGTGLGLAIARAIVQALGGTITMQSREGAGTSVTIELAAETCRRPAGATTGEAP